LAGLATVFCGLAALNSVLGDDSFAALTAVVLCAGYGASITLRRLGYTARIVELTVIAGALVIYGQLIAGQTMSALIVPLQATGTPELRVAAMLLWLEVLRSFTLVSDDSVVFSAVPSVVLISLAATSNVNPEIMAFFVMYLVLAAFMLAHRRASGRSQLKPAFRVALVVAVLALTLGSVVVIPVREVCTRAFALAMPDFIRFRERIQLLGYGDPDSLQIAQGPVRLSRATIMIVRARMVGSKEPVSAYWRGRVFDQYTGHGWKISQERPSLVVGRSTSSGWGYQFGAPAGAGERRLEQVFQTRPLENSRVYAASEPVVVYARRRVLQRDAFNCWQGIRGRLEGMAYRVESSLPTTEARKLRRAGTRYPEEIRQYSLQTLTSTGRAGELAKRITAGITNPYDKAQAIQRYLGEKHIYDLNAPPAPAAADAVDYFLFTSGVGYCDVFASAMVVMCREAGIPARLATGFSTGVYDPDLKLFRVRDMDRHAWAEVYFPGSGWVTFDPTTLTRSAEGGWLARTSRSIRRAVLELFGGPAALPAAVLLLAGCAVVAFGSEIRRIRIMRRPAGPSRLHAALVGRYWAMRRILGVRREDLTPIEAASTAHLPSPEARRIALDAARLFGEIRYGNRGVALGDVRALERLLRELKAAARRRRSCP
jgi:uncharacterized membrane protein SirB2